MAPVADKVEELDVQITLGLATAPIVGKLFTVTLVVAILVQLLASVPVTVYEVIIEGETVTLDVFAPVLHVYVITLPEVVNVAELPKHTVGDTSLILIFAGDEGLIVADDPAVQPLLSVTFKV